MELSLWKMMMNDDTQRLLEHLKDLQRRRDIRGIHTESWFLNEEEQAEAMLKFPPSDQIRYDGGYADARKKKSSSREIWRMTFLISYVSLHK